MEINKGKLNNYIFCLFMFIVSLYIILSMDIIPNLEFF